MKISNYSCYLDNISFSELLNRCTLGQKLKLNLKNQLSLKEKNSYHILVVDNSRDRLAYEFYLQFAKSMEYAFNWT